tara:strand:+ start:2587 stop:3228 length:642 start_codon:yes stop_codon:yes gene_type:complete
MFRLGIVIPSKNEFQSLKKIVNKLREKKLNFVIINDGSTDNTDKYLKENKLNFIKNQISIGYTRSIIKGVKYFRSKNFDYILTMDADGEHNIKYLNKFKKKLNTKDYDLIVANRFYKNRVSEKIVSFFTKHKLAIEDPLSGFKLYKVRTFIENIKYFNDNNFFVDYMAFLIKKNYKVININYHNKILKNRKSRMGNNFILNLKIIFMLRFFLK